MSTKECSQVFQPLGNLIWYGNDVSETMFSGFPTFKKLNMSRKQCFLVCHATFGKSGMEMMFPTVVWPLCLGYITVRNQCFRKKMYYLPLWSTCHQQRSEDKDETERVNLAWWHASFRFLSETNVNFQLCAKCDKWILRDCVLLFVVHNILFYYNIM